MTYFATKQKINWDSFDDDCYCEGPEYFVCFVDFDFFEAVFDTREYLRGVVEKGHEIHIYKSLVSREDFNFSKAWDYVIDGQAELILY